MRILGLIIGAWAAYTLGWLSSGGNAFVGLVAVATLVALVAFDKMILNKKS